MFSYLLCIRHTEFPKYIWSAVCFISTRRDIHILILRFGVSAYCCQRCSWTEWLTIFFIVHQIWRICHFFLVVLFVWSDRSVGPWSNLLWLTPLCNCCGFLILFLYFFKRITASVLCLEVMKPYQMAFVLSLLPFYPLLFFLIKYISILTVQKLSFQIIFFRFVAGISSDS